LYRLADPCLSDILFDKPVSISVNFGFDGRVHSGTLQGKGKGKGTQACSMFEHTCDGIGQDNERRGHIYRALKEERPAEDDEYRISIR
jgi:hypothetical protein